MFAMDDKWLDNYRGYGAQDSEFGYTDFGDKTFFNYTPTDYLNVEDAGAAWLDYRTDPFPTSMVSEPLFGESADRWPDEEYDNEDQTGFWDWLKANVSFKNVREAAKAYNTLRGGKRGQPRAKYQIPRKYTSARGGRMPTGGRYESTQVGSLPHAAMIKNSQEAQRAAKLIANQTQGKFAAISNDDLAAIISGETKPRGTKTTLKSTIRGKHTGTLSA